MGLKAEMKERYSLCKINPAVLLDTILARCVESNLAIVSNLCVNLIIRVRLTTTVTHITILILYQFEHRCCYAPILDIGLPVVFALGT
jgi:hypothetical protein